ncbi:hypothetical protein AOLI_G00027630 [Acnodon oligacanthus]
MTVQLVSCVMAKAAVEPRWGRSWSDVAGSLQSLPASSSHLLHSALLLKAQKPQRCRPIVDSLPGVVDTAGAARGGRGNHVKRADLSSQFVNGSGHSGPHMAGLLQMAAGWLLLSAHRSITSPASRPAHLSIQPTRHGPGPGPGPGEGETIQMFWKDFSGPGNMNVRKIIGRWGHLHSAGHKSL